MWNYDIRLPVPAFLLAAMLCWCIGLLMGVGLQGLLKWPTECAAEGGE